MLSQLQTWFAGAPLDAEPMYHCRLCGIFPTLRSLTVSLYRLLRARHRRVHQRAMLTDYFSEFKRQQCMLYALQ